MNRIKSIYLFYKGGFARMTVGKTLWKIIAIKLFVMFGILKIFFFQDYLSTNFDTDEQRSAYVIDQITNIK